MPVGIISESAFADLLLIHAALPTVSFFRVHPLIDMKTFSTFVFFAIPHTLKIKGASKLNASFGLDD